ncbi:MAG: phosphopeptide-binding protein, partial [Bacteroidota bacterium]|nr:phosphopeptide-binding protein [Bacteroidota bacterium]
AKLEIISPEDSSMLKSGKVYFQYKVHNYQLATQTIDAGQMHCANSKEGQHIHNILNNEPYTAHYTDTFTKSLEPGHYVNLSFLSRSYHESIKNGEAFTLTQFTVGQAKPMPADLKAPHLFYSRPKGEYKGADTAHILLDFFLVNTTLSPDGNKVKVTIDGTEFLLTDWKPYAVQGLDTGEHTFELELIDKDGKRVVGPFNYVKRTITLSR